MKLTAVSPKVDHIIFNPPASAPTPLITPTMFLPQSDMRRTLMATLKPAAAESKPLPPPLKPITQKSYHLTPADVKRMRKLRKEDPVKWHRHALAKEFNCSRLFVGISCQATPERVEQMKARFEKIKGKWGPKRTIARQDRQRRKAGWGGADGL